MGDSGRMGGPGKGPKGWAGSGEYTKGQHAMGDSNAGAIAEGGRAGTGKDVSGARAQDRAGAAKERRRDGWRNCAGADEPIAKKRSQVKSSQELLSGIHGARIKQGP